MVQEHQSFPTHPPKPSLSLSRSLQSLGIVVLQEKKPKHRRANGLFRHDWEHVSRIPGFVVPSFHGPDCPLVQVEWHREPSATCRRPWSAFRAFFSSPCSSLHISASLWGAEKQTSIIKTNQKSNHLVHQVCKLPTINSVISPKEFNER